MFPFWVILDGFLASSSLEAKRVHLRRCWRRCCVCVYLNALQVGDFQECVCEECVSVNLTFNNRRRRALPLPLAAGAVSSSLITDMMVSDIWRR